MEMNPRSVALVGRPNVGKSRLFNRLAGRRLAIVHDQAGVTRDVNSVEVDRDYMLLDTGGIGLVADMTLAKLVEAAEEQVWFAVEAASVICFIVDAREGLTPLDEVIGARLRESGKPIILVVNKVDSSDLEERAYEFDTLGFTRLVCVSAEHGRNESELREFIQEALGPRREIEQQEEEGEGPARIGMAFVGRPNVGKSSLCNRLLASDRLVVSEVPGTTRDSVSLDLDFDAGGGVTQHFRLVDTAGLRRKSRVSSSVEYFSALRTRDAIAGADVVFLVVDSKEGVSQQEKTMVGEIVEAGKAVAVVVNKWDLAIDLFIEDPIPGYDDIEAYRKSYARAAEREIFFLPSSPVLFVSARTGFAIEDILRTAHRLWEKSGTWIPTPRVNKLMKDLIGRQEPRHIKGKRFKAYYAVQTGIRPITFRIFCNRATRLDDSYRRYLQGHFLREFGLDGCPLRFDLRGKTVRYANKD